LKVVSMMPGTTAADRRGVRQRDVTGAARGILRDRDEVGDAAAFDMNSLRTVWPGALGAIITTSISARGTIWL
jgi:hypothetical protein